jgi:Fe2+ transport system protein FeoA
MTTLSECQINFEGPIQELHGDGVLLSRLREMGFIRGERVRIWGRAPFGEPFLVEIRGVTVALRKREAQCIRV